MNFQLLLTTLMGYGRTPICGLFFLVFLMMPFSAVFSNSENPLEAPPVMDPWIYNSGNPETINISGSNVDVPYIKVTNNTSLTVNLSQFSYTNLNITGVNAPDDVAIFIQSGSSVSIVGGQYATLFIKHTGTGNTSNIAGDLSLGLSTSSRTVIYKPENSAKNVTTVTGSITAHDRARVDGTTASLIFANGGTYTHNAQHSGNKIPVATWQTGSSTLVTGFSNQTNIPGNFDQTFYDLEWNCPNQTGSISFLNERPTILGTFKIASTGSGKLQLNKSTSNVEFTCNIFVQTGGTLNMATTSGSTTLKVSGNFSQTGGAILRTSSTADCTIEFNGTSSQVISYSNVSSTIDYHLNNPAGATGQLTVNTGADLTITQGGLSTVPIYSGSNGLIYNGSSPQSVGAEWQDVARLTIDNPSGVSASNDITVSDELNLNNGALSLGSAVLALGTSASSTGTYNYSSGRIIGKFKRWVASAAAAYDFHIGTTTDARTTNVNFTSNLASGGTVTAEYIGSNPGTGGLPITVNGITLNDVSPTGYWRVEAGNGLAGATYTITVDASGFNQPSGQPVSEPGKTRMIKRPTGGNWAPDGTSNMPTSLSAISISDLNSFSEFGVGVEGIALPIVLVDFSASQNGAANLIEWTVARQVNTFEFSIEKSEDGRDWMLQEEVPAAGNTELEMTYSAKDSEPNCLSYYRLRSIDFDGSEEVFAAEAVQRDCAGLSFGNVNPNPATSVLNIDFEVSDYQSISYRLSNLTGQVLTQGSWELEAGEYTQTLQLDGLPSGLYHLSFFDGKNWYVQRFFKK